MAEELNLVGSSIRRRRVRRALMAGGILLIIGTCLVTGYFAFPLIVLSHCLRYETYYGANGLTLGIQDTEKRKPPSGLVHRWAYPEILDRDRRYIRVVAPRTEGDDNPYDEYGGWAIVDSEEERIVASMRVPQFSHEFLGVQMETRVGRSPLLADTDEAINWTIACRGPLPAWWPGRSLWGWNGEVKRADILSFDTAISQWKYAGQPTSEAQWPNCEGWLDSVFDRSLQRYYDRSMLLSGSSDEIVAEHEDGQEKRLSGRARLRRLFRRNREDGTIRWEVQPADMPPRGPKESFYQVFLPACALESSVEWCMLVQEEDVPNAAFWRLDLTSGHVSSVSPPMNATLQDPRVASDGQTVVFREDGGLYMSGVPPVPEPSVQLTEKPTADLVAWQPNGELKTLCSTVLPRMTSVDMHHIVLPRRRVLLTQRELEKLTIQIISLDGGPPRQIYP